MEEIYTPILLVGFNRVDSIRQSLNSIREVKPQKLYIGIDGPRLNNKEDLNKIAEVKKEVENIDWKCQVYYKFSEVNLGCKGNITSSISWALENEDRVIIVEDDIVAPKSFFIFLQQMLEKYKNEDSIASVTGNNYTPLHTETDYFFSRVAGHIWGWGTWKRVWEKFDVNLPELDSSFSNNFSTVKFTSKLDKIRFILYCRNIKKAQLTGTDNYWGPQWGIFRRIHNYLNIVPAKNLASNIGSISSRDMKNNSEPGKWYWKSDPDFKIKNHPMQIVANEKYDIFHFKNHLFKVSFFGKIKMIIRYILNI